MGEITSNGSLPFVFLLALLVRSGLKACGFPCQRRALSMLCFQSNNVRATILFFAFVCHANLSTADTGTPHTLLQMI